MVDKITGILNMSNPRNIFIRSIHFFNAPLLMTLMIMLPAAARAQDPADAPVAYSSVNELSGILTQLQQTAQSMQADLQKTRIEKWKTDGATKRQTQNNVDSLKRNLQTALPDVIAQLNSAPEDAGASFKLYRNLDALYDVFGSVVESAGAFGSKDEFQSLSNDMSGLESARRNLGERVQKLTSAKEDELKRLRAQVKTLAAGPPAPPKKTVIDDTEPAKKSAAKKKATKPKPATTPAPAPANAAPPNN
jgi:DNA repair exonuclease SbcCD ATPase subunit